MIRKMLAIIMIGLAVTACTDQPQAQGNKQTQAQKAAEAARSITFTENAEIDNIKRRLELTSSPGALGFIILLNESGQPILYEGVKGKITSGSKRLTAPEQLWNVDKGEWGGSELGPAPSDEGTWGSSSPYIFYWNTAGEYRQWSGEYLYSDKPMRLSVQPLVVNVNPTSVPKK